MGDSQAVKEIHWLEVFPWLRLWNCLWIAISPGNLVIAFAGVILTYLGWGIIDTVLPLRPAARIVLKSGTTFPGVQTQGPIVPGEKGKAPSGAGWVAPHFPLGGFAVDEPSAADSVAGLARSKSILEQWVPPTWRVKSSWGMMPGMDRLEDPMIGIWWQISSPFAALFRAENQSWLGRVRSTLQGVWIVAVWAMFGSMITRSAVLEIAGAGRPTWRELWQFATARWLHNFFAPLGLVLVVVSLWLILTLGGMLLLTTDIGLALAGVCWPLALAVGLAATLTLVGLMFGWPLLSPSISADGQDGFGAVGTAFSYVYRRPLLLAFYVIVAAVLGWLTWVIVSAVAESLISLTNAATQAGLSAKRIHDISQASANLSWAGKFGTNAIQGWLYLVQSMAVSFLFSYFWAASTMIYLFLRRSVDGTEMNEVFVEETEEDSYAVTPPRTLAAGADPADG